jgi:hypothetical protein
MIKLIEDEVGICHDSVDTTFSRTTLEFRMEPRNGLVKKILKICKFALRESEKAGDGIMVAGPSCDALV